LIRVHSCSKGLLVKKLVIASNNPGKIRELAALLSPHGLELVAQADLGVAEANEPHETFVENALAKARHASQITGLPALADDSGLCVPALGGAPGVHSAYYAGREGVREQRDARNNARLVAELREHRDRRAYYYCVLVLMRGADDPAPIVADAAWHGRIETAPRGSAGFGYDPHFLPDGARLTAAEMAPEQKNRVSHRAQALQRLLAQIAARQV
jgi:XTP/dITP diphosphohydrolase